MALKIGCPHCHGTLVAESETAGQEKLCPSCGKGFTVPIPVRGAPRHVEVARQCPKCRAEIAPGTAYCPHCYFDLAAGRRLSLRRRLKFVLPRTWTLVGLGTVGAVALAFVGVHVYRDHVRRTRQPASAWAPVQEPGEAAGEWIKRLLVAESASERSEAFNELLRLGPAALPGLARALEGSAAGGEDQSCRNREAAVELFARSGDARWLPVLRKLQKDRRLRGTVLRARALLGDAEVADELGAVWLTCLRREMFLTRVVELAPGALTAADQAVIRWVQSETEGHADALCGLVELPEAMVIEGVLAAYWESWSWLGQGRDEAFAVKLFELAKPSERRQADFKVRVRTARRVLERAAQRGSPAARAAAAVILAHCAPQYKSLRERIIVTLASILPECQPPAQQRVAWALARLTSRTFDGRSDENAPVDFGRAAVEDVLKWARSSGTAEPGPLRASRAAYPSPPKLVRRVVTPRRQLERDLLRELRSGWRAVDPVLDRWLEAELGCTPRVEQFLDPGQREPDYPALATAMILAAEDGAQRLRPQLALWREATDQPAWVRGFAYSTLGVLDARRGEWSSGWPAGLEAGMTAHLGDSAPGLKLWGRLLAAGGPALRTRLEEAPAGSLSAAMRARLLHATEQAAVSRPGAP